MTTSYKFKFIVKDSDSNIIENSIKTLDYDTEVTFNQIAETLASEYQNFTIESCMASGQEVSHTDTILDYHYFMVITIKIN